MGSSRPPPTAASPLVNTYISTLAALFPGLNLPCRPRSVRSLHPDPQTANYLLSLIISGVITARTSWPAQGTLPEAGDIAVIIDSSHIPVAIVRTKQVDIVPFLAVAEGFVRDEGERDGSLEKWRKVRGREFERRQTEECRWSDEEMVVCERFELVYPLKCMETSCVGKKLEDKKKEKKEEEVLRST